MGPERRIGRGGLVAATVSVGALAIAAVVWLLVSSPLTAPSEGGGAEASAPVVAEEEFSALGAADLEALPEVRYDAVIGGLIPYAEAEAQVDGRYELRHDAALYGEDRRTPVARFAAIDFLSKPSTVVVVDQDGDWSLVMTPARVTLPSEADGAAPAQSAAWVRTSDLRRTGDLPARVVISVADATLTIHETGAEPAVYAVGVGTPDTPTPTGVTGYLQQRYLDPGQGAATHPIQLTSLHATAHDEPYGGTDGGLIGIHFNTDNDGAVSHGCIRLSGEAIEAVDRLPLGTPVSIVP